jgi:ABC-2 type transport system permease protein
VSPARRYRSAALGIAWRHLNNGFRNPEYFLPAVFFPLVFLTAFAGGLSSMVKVPGFHYPLGYTSFQYVFVMLQTASFGGVYTGFSLAMDYEAGFARRLMLTTPHRSAIVVGYAIGALGRLTFFGSLVTVVALVSGMNVTLRGVSLFGLVLLCVIVSMTASLFASGIALRLRTIQAGALMQMPLMLVLFLAPVYVPLGLLRGWFHALASVNPATAFLTAGRNLLDGRGGSVGLAFAAVTALLLLFAFLAVRGLRKAETAG